MNFTVNVRRELSNPSLLEDQASETCQYSGSLRRRKYCPSRVTVDATVVISPPTIGPRSPGSGTKTAAKARMIIRTKINPMSWRRVTHSPENNVLHHERHSVGSSGSGRGGVCLLRGLAGVVFCFVLAHKLIDPRGRRRATRWHLSPMPGQVSRPASPRSTREQVQVRPRAPGMSLASALTHSLGTFSNMGSNQ